ncbi:MAG: protein sorting system archaetidylserine decarboxylase [Halobacteriales archaeon]
MNIAPGGWKYGGLLGLLSLPAFFVTSYASAVLLFAGAFTLWFFRDPERDPPGQGVVSPADGTVSVIRNEGGRIRVGIFMNVDDVHVNRAPLGGAVESVEHRPGANRPAFRKESDRNEQVEIAFDDHVVILIAGWFARRITPYVEPGDIVERGARIGQIAFGSRADVVLPERYERADLAVTEGDSVRAGESVIASQ